MSNAAGRLLRACTLICAAAAAASGYAQDYPNKAIRIVIANSAGTIGDLIARVLGQEMSKTLGQPLVLENKPGGAGVVGFQYVAKQVPADGYTVILAEPITLATLPLMVKDLGFDPVKDVPPLLGIAETRYTFGVTGQNPWKSLNEVVVAAKANPGKLNFGSGALSSRLPAEMLFRALGINVTFVPFGGGGPYMQGLASSQVHMGFLVEQPAVALGDKYRTVAVTGETRSKHFPGIPTFKELGVTSIQDLSLEFTLNARAGTPKAVLDKLSASASRALKQPQVKTEFEKIYMEIVERNAEVAQKRLAEQARRFAEIGRELGIQPQ